MKPHRVIGMMLIGLSAFCFAMAIHLIRTGG